MRSQAHCLLVSYAAVSCIVLGACVTLATASANITTYSCGAPLANGTCRCTPEVTIPSGSCTNYAAEHVSVNMTCDAAPLQRACVEYALFSAADCSAASAVMLQVPDFSNECRTLAGLSNYGSGSITAINATTLQFNLMCFGASNATECANCAPPVTVAINTCTLLLNAVENLYVVARPVQACTGFTTALSLDATCTSPLGTQRKVANVCVNNTLVGCVYPSVPSTAKPSMAPTTTTAVPVPGTTQGPRTSVPATTAEPAPHNTTSTPSRAPSTASSSPLSVGAEAGIGIGAVAVVGIGLAIWFIRRRRGGYGEITGDQVLVNA